MKRKHAVKAVARADSDYAKMMAAKLGALSRSPAMRIAMKLKRLAEMRVWRERSLNLFQAQGGVPEINRLVAECERAQRIYLYGSIRPSRELDPITRLETGPMNGPLIYQPEHLRHLADCIEALRQSVQPLHELLQWIHRESNTVAQTAAIAGPMLKRKNNRDFRRQVRTALTELGRTYAPDTPGRPPKSGR